MSVPINLSMWIMACLSVIVLPLLATRFQWGATEVTPVGLAVTAITGTVFYKASIRLLAAESTKGIWGALIILLIVWTAILLHQVADEARASLVIRNGTRKLLPNELLMVLALGWMLESFLQGITGLDAPMAVGAPLPVDIGIVPVFAAIILSLGQVWGNTFGILAAAWDALATSTGLMPGTPDYLAAAFWTDVFTWIWNVVIGLVVCWFCGKEKAVRRGLPALLILSLIQRGGELLLARANTTIAYLLPACLSPVTLILIDRMKMYKQEWSVEDNQIMDRGAASGIPEGTPDNITLVQAFIPYTLLTAATMVALVAPLVDRSLNQVSIEFSSSETSTGYGFVNQVTELFSPLRPFTHASTFLFLSPIAELAYLGRYEWIHPGGAKRVFIRSVTMFIPSEIAITGLVTMPRIMGGTGQANVLADGIARVLGKTYVILTPLVGMVRSFMTGNNVSSNILLGKFQITIVNLLHLSQAPVLRAQTAGDSIGSAISPSNIIPGTTTAGILGNEGRVLKRTIPFMTIMTLAIGIIVSLSMVVS